MGVRAKEVRAMERCAGCAGCLSRLPPLGEIFVMDSGSFSRKEGLSVLPACLRDGIVDISVFLVFNTRSTLLPTTQTFCNVYHDLNSSPPIMTTDEAEQTTLDRDGSGPPDELSGFFYDAYRKPESSGSGSESGKVQQAKNDTLFEDPLPLEVGNSQAEQDQGQVESTTLEASHSAPTPLVSESIPIPSIIDTRHDLSHGPYEQKTGQPEYFMPSVDPDQILLDHDSEVMVQTEEVQSSPDNSKPGPIPPIMGMHQDLGDGPDDPHQDSYTVLTTRLSRAEAKVLRDQIRNSGLDAFAAPEWEATPDRPRYPGWKFFKHSERNILESASTVHHDNRKGINHFLVQEDRRTQKSRRLTMVVQRDGGEVKLENLVPRPRQRLTAIVLNHLFVDFEV